MNEDIIINKSTGITRTEKLLAKLCNNTFLETLSYPNPYNSAGKELCDLIAIFDNHLYLFFDREIVFKKSNLNQPEVVWDRWFRKVIEKQIKTCNGSERYLKTGGSVFLDPTKKVPFPINIDINTVSIDKIILAHGAEDACKAISESNINGSLGIEYSDGPGRNVTGFPFAVQLSKENIIHIFDSYNMPVIFQELDTFYDFTQYIVEKERAIDKYKILAYCGEEDLLAHYFRNFDSLENRHYIGTKEQEIDGVYIEEGMWSEFIESDIYKRKKEADKSSYLWDRLIQKTCNNALLGVLGGNSNLFAGESAIYEMAKEPRFSRRALSDAMGKAITNFPMSNSYAIRNMSFMPSFYKNKAYIFYTCEKQHLFFLFCCSFRPVKHGFHKVIRNNRPNHLLQNLKNLRS